MVVGTVVVEEEEMVVVVVGMMGVVVAQTVVVEGMKRVVGAQTVVVEDMMGVVVAIHVSIGDQTIKVVAAHLVKVLVECGQEGVGMVVVVVHLVKVLVVVRLVKVVVECGLQGVGILVVVVVCLVKVLVECGLQRVAVAVVLGHNQSGMEVVHPIKVVKRGLKGVVKLVVAALKKEVGIWCQKLREERDPQGMALWVHLEILMMILSQLLTCQKVWLLPLWTMLIGLVRFNDQIQVANWRSEPPGFLLITFLLSSVLRVS